jgi:hypothetical protein
VPRASTKREYCRHLFNQGATPAQRHSYLDTLRDAALEAQTEGKTLSQTASGGQSASFLVFGAFSPEDTLALVDEARAWADALTLTAALALIPTAVRHYGRDFSGLQCGGAV